MGPTLSRATRHAARPLVVLVMLACGEGPTAPAPPPGAELELVSGGAQEGVAGYLLDAPVTVRAREADGAPIPFVALRASVAAPFAGTTPLRGITDADGLVRFEWRLGLALGPQELLVSLPGRPEVGALRVEVTSRSHAMRAIGGGATVMCGIDAVGMLGCWHPTRDPDHPPTVTRHVGPERFTSLAVSPGLARPMDACAVTEGGRAWCFAVAPDATIADLHEIPGSYPPLATVVGGGADAAAWCGLDGAGSAWCWGANGGGLLGDGSEVASGTPVAVATTTRFTRLAIGSHHACGISATESVWCWGANATAQLGRPPTPTPFLTPVRVAGDFQWVDLAIPSDRTTCAVERGSGYPWCWGDKTLLGIPLTTVAAIEDSYSPVPRYVEPLATVVGIGRVDGATVVLREGAVGAWWGDLAPTREITLAAVPQIFVTSLGFGSLATPHASGVLCGTPTGAEAPLCVLFGALTGYEIAAFAGFGMPF